MEQLILPILLFGGMYMLLIRPQQKKAKEQRALVDRASAGDRIMLSSGLFGTITEVLASTAYIEVAEGIEILVSRVHIQEILDEFPTEPIGGTSTSSPMDQELEDDDTDDELEDHEA